MRNILRRPARSAIRPNSSVNPAAGRARAVVIHCSESSENPSESPITGRETVRMEKSAASMNWAPNMHC